MIIKVLGSGCKKCIKLENNIKNILLKENISAQVIKETDIVEISKYNVMSTPGIVINENLVSAGRIPSDKEIIQFIQANL